jgi:phage gp46-like protein
MPLDDAILVRDFLGDFGELGAVQHPGHVLRHATLGALVQVGWSQDHGDISVMPSGLGTGPAIEAAVLVSLFTDRRAAPDDKVLDSDRRGWWGDSYSDRPIGSRMWLLLRSKRTTETLRRARDYIIEALQWLVDDGAAARFDVLTEWTKPGVLGAQITIYRTDGRNLSLSNAWAWE